MSTKTLIEQFVEKGISAQQAVNEQLAKRKPAKSRCAPSIRITAKARALICEIILAADQFDGAAEVLADKTISESLAMNAGRDKMRANESLAALAYRLSYEVRGKKVWN